MSTQTAVLSETLQSFLRKLGLPNLPKLIIFDFDGTLVEFKTDVILPNVREFFQAVAQAEDKPQFAIASNQGGVGLHHWMQEGKFGGDNYLKYPSISDAEARFKRFHNTLPLGIEMPVFVCYAYMSGKGNWAVPPSFVNEDDKQWWANRRKPEPGMLLDAMEEFGALRKDTLMVGDLEEDEIAASAAGCHFIHADRFFNRG
jgi:FMN phosphatase YigB (HAD superfamily)